MAIKKGSDSNDRPNEKKVHKSSEGRRKSVNTRREPFGRKAMVVGSITDDGKRIVGLLLADVYHRIASPFPLQAVVDMINRGVVHNAHISSNGQIELLDSSEKRLPRYDVRGNLIPDTSAQIRVLAVVPSADGETYLCLRHDGKFGVLSESDLYTQAKALNVYNAKAVSRDGKNFVSALNGSFYVLELDTRPVVSQESYKKRYLSRAFSIYLERFLRHLRIEPKHINKSVDVKRVQVLFRELIVPSYGSYKPFESFLLLDSTKLNINTVCDLLNSFFYSLLVADARKVSTVYGELPITFPHGRGGFVDVLKGKSARKKGKREPVKALAFLFTKANRFSDVTKNNMGAELSVEVQDIINRLKIVGTIEKGAYTSKSQVVSLLASLFFDHTYSIKTVDTFTPNINAVMQYTPSDIDYTSAEGLAHFGYSLDMIMPKDYEPPVYYNSYVYNAIRAKYYLGDIRESLNKLQKGGYAFLEENINCLGDITIVENLLRLIAGRIPTSKIAKYGLSRYKVMVVLLAYYNKPLFDWINPMLNKFMLNESQIQGIKSQLSAFADDDIKVYYMSGLRFNKADKILYRGQSISSPYTGGRVKESFVPLYKAPEQLEALAEFYIN